MEKEFAGSLAGLHFLSGLQQLGTPTQGMVPPTDGPLTSVNSHDARSPAGQSARRFNPSVGLLSVTPGCVMLAIKAN